LAATENIVSSLYGRRLGLSLSLTSVSEILTFLKIVVFASQSVGAYSKINDTEDQKIPNLTVLNNKNAYLRSKL